MPESSDGHELLRQEWAETPPDVSYRFVVSPETLRAADAVVRVALKKKRSAWRRALAFPVSWLLRYVVSALMIALIVWLSWQAGFLVDRLSSGVVPPIAAFLVAVVGLMAGLRIGLRRLTRLPLGRLYQEFYSGNEFLLEGRKSHLWFDERSAGAIRRWSTFGRLVEFEEGMWLFLRRSRTFAGLRGILISKESLPGSCAWSELQAYLRQRIAEGARDEAEAQKISNA
jgi:hypothetical protein